MSCRVHVATLWIFCLSATSTKTTTTSHSNTLNLFEDPHRRTSSLPHSILRKGKASLLSQSLRYSGNLSSSVYKLSDRLFIDRQDGSSCRNRCCCYLCVLGSCCSLHARLEGCQRLGSSAIFPLERFKLMLILRS